jgi:hypothetical protein
MPYHLVIRARERALEFAEPACSYLVGRSRSGPRTSGGRLLLSFLFLGIIFGNTSHSSGYEENRVSGKLVLGDLCLSGQFHFLQDTSAFSREHNPPVIIREVIRENVLPILDAIDPWKNMHKMLALVEHDFLEEEGAGEDEVEEG